MKKEMKTGVVVTACVAAAVLIAGAAATGEKRNVSQRSSEASIQTNDNGSVSRTFVECTVTTNGNMVTEHRRETRTTLDTEGNMLETSTSEYAQSYSVGDVGRGSITASIADKADGGKEPAAVNADTFLGLKFGETFGGTNFVSDADEPTLLRAKFVPAKVLAGFDDYYVYVTPKTHRIAKVYACARDAVEPGARWRRHYLIEALEKRYQTWARLCSYSRPCYAFDIGAGRYVTACLSDASRDYETVVAAWDDGVLGVAAQETEEERERIRKEAAENRARRVSAAASAF